MSAALTLLSSMAVKRLLADLIGFNRKILEEILYHLRKSTSSTISLTPTDEP